MLGIRYAKPHGLLYVLMGTCFWAVFGNVFLIRTVATFLILIAFRCLVSETIALVALVDVQMWCIFLNFVVLKAIDNESAFQNGVGRFLVFGEYNQGSTCCGSVLAA